MMSKLARFKIALTVLSVGAVLYASYTIVQHKRAESHFHQGLSRYVSGNMEQSIDSLEESYGINPDNENTKRLLERVLVENALDSFSGQNMKRVWPCWCARRNCIHRLKKSPVLSKTSAKSWSPGSLQV